jgi:chromosome segregation ATPase
MPCPYLRSDKCRKFIYYMCDNIWVKCRLFRCLQLTEERDKLSAELESAKKTLELLDNDELFQHLAQVEKELESARKEIQDCHTISLGDLIKISKQNSELVDKDKEIETLKSQNALKAKEISDQWSMIVALGDEVKGLRDNNPAYITQEAHHKELHEQIAELKEQLDAYKESENK